MFYAWTIKCAGKFNCKLFTITTKERFIIIWLCNVIIIMCACQIALITKFKIVNKGLTEICWCLNNKMNVINTQKNFEHCGANDWKWHVWLRSAPLWKSVSNIMVKLQKSFKIVWLFHGIDGAHSMSVHYVRALNFLSIFAIPSKFIVPTDKTGSEELVLGRFLRHTSMLLRVLKFQSLFQFTLDWSFKLFFIKTNIRNETK